MKRTLKFSDSEYLNGRLDAKGLVILECHTGHSGSLKIMEPVFAKLREKFGDHILHMRLNVENNFHVIHELHIYHDPTYLIFMNGSLIRRIEELIPYREFERTISWVLKIDNILSDKI